MALEAKDIFEAFKIEPVETKEDFIKALEAKGYVQKEMIFKDETLKKEIFGRAFGAATTGVVQKFRNIANIELSGKDLENPIEKIIETGLTRLNETFEAQKTEIESKTKLSVDERVKQAEEAKKQLSLKVGELEGLVKTKAEEFESLLSQKDQEVKTIRLNTLQSETERSINYLPDLDPLKKKGWLSDMKERYKIQTEEDGSPYIVQANDGSRVKSTQHAGTFLTPAEVYQMEAAKAGIVNINQNGGKSAQGRSQAPANPVMPKRTEQPGRIVAPAAIVP